MTHLTPLAPLLSLRYAYLSPLHSVNTHNYVSYHTDLVYICIHYIYYAQVLTCGGGARNEVWTAMRQHRLGVPTSKAGQV